jgi:hypothetical protein
LLAWVAVCGLAAVSWIAAARGQAPAARERSRTAPAAKQQRQADGDDAGTMRARITRRSGPLQDDDAESSGAHGVPFALKPGDALWTLVVNDSGEILIHHRGVEMVRGSPSYRAEAGKAAGAQFKVVARSSNQVRILGTVEGLGLQAQGRARPLSAHELKLEMNLVATESFSGITGGGWSWKLRLDSPSVGGKSADPKLLLDKTGWRWAAAPDEEVMVRFDEPVARLFFERDQKNDIRTSFIGDRIRPGRARIGLTVTLPDAGLITALPEERYPKPDSSWFRQALRWDLAPLDLSFLNADDRPAGRHGMVKVDGDHLVFEDGTPARFWGANLSGPVLFQTPRENIPRQARRMARLGYNVMRIVQHESNWVKPNIFGADYRDTRHLDRRSLDTLDYWIKCLKDEGIYVWLDMHYLRELKPGDGVSLGRDEIAREKNVFFGFNYVNPELLNLMKEFQHQYLGHVNRYTGMAYKDDPAVIGVLITNENDLSFHFGLSFLPDRRNPVHKALFDREMQAFAQITGLPADRLWRTWEPGPSKYLLAELEHQFNRKMIEDLRSDGVKAPIATTNLWGANALFSLPSLTDGDVVDVHAYGHTEALGADPRCLPNFLSHAAAAHVQGKPMTITEWNVPYPESDRFTTPLYVASIASLQGWVAPMIYNYSQKELERPGPEEGKHRINLWSTYYDPAITAVMPAAAIAFRRGHISPARTSYCLKLSPAQLLGTELTAENSATIRTLVEQSKLTIGMPSVKELPWLRPSEPSGDVTVVTDPDHDFIPAGQTTVRSDTGELARDWKEGILTIDTPRTQAVLGWIGGKPLSLKDATFHFKTAKAVVALSSIDDQPLASSRFILVTAVGQARPSPATDMGRPLADRPPDHLPFLSEPVIGTIKLKNKTAGLELLAMGSDGRVASRSTPLVEKESLSIQLPAGRGTHWYVLKTPPPTRKPDEAR